MTNLSKSLEGRGIESSRPLEMGEKGYSSSLEGLGNESSRSLKRKKKDLLGIFTVTGRKGSSRPLERGKRIFKSTGRLREKNLRCSDLGKGENRSLRLLEGRRNRSSRSLKRAEKCFQGH